MRDPGETATTRNRRPFGALLAATAISRLGSMLTLVALPWFVLQTTGSAAKTGVTLATGAVPYLVAGILGGVLVDRLGYRQSSVLSDVGSGICVAAIPLLAHTVGLAFWQLLVLVFLGTLVGAPGMTARDSLLPDLAARAGLPLERANGIIQAVRRVALLVGPAVAGVLIALLGAGNVLWLDGASFLVSAAIVALAVPRDAVAPPAAHAYLREVLDGFRFVRADGLLLWLVVTFAVGSLVSEPLYTVVLPVYARQVFASAVDLGLMESALAAGSLLGLLAYALMGPRLPRRATLLGGFTARALAFWVLVALPPLPVLLGAIVLEAVCFEPINPLTTSLLQRRVPEGLRGRVFGTFDALTSATFPVGTLLGGLLLARWGLVASLMVFAAASLAHAASLPLVPALRRLDRPAGVPLLEPPAGPATVR